MGMDRTSLPLWLTIRPLSELNMVILMLLYSLSHSLSLSDTYTQSSLSQYIYTGRRKCWLHVYRENSFVH